MNPILQTLGQSADRWQAVYIVSISFALVSTFAMVYFAFHKEHPLALRTSNYFYVAASFLAVLSTIVIVNKTKAIDSIKDTFVAKANHDAAEANRKAEEAHDAAVTVEQENLRLQAQVLTLQTQVLSETKRATVTEAALAKSNKDTSDFAHSLQQQQGIMTEQAKVSPQLTPFQIQALANYLRPYSGQNLKVHLTLDTVVVRLANSIQTALSMAGIKQTGSMDAGQTYQGVSVAVHDAASVPPLADALVRGLQQAGIVVHPATAPDMVPAGEVGLYLGPN